MTNMRLNMLNFVMLLIISCKTAKITVGDKTIREIEEIQKNAVEKVYGEGVIPSFLNPDTLKNEFDAIDNWFKYVQGEEFMTEKDKTEVFSKISKLNPPTKYQDVGTYFLLSMLIEKTQKANSQIKLFKDSLTPKYATIWTNEINAEARKINNEYVLFFNKRIFDFCLTMSKIGSKPVEFQKEEGSQMSLSISIDELFNRVEKDTLLQNRFIYAIEEFHFNASPRPFLLSSNHNSMVFSLLNAMELFVMSHEYTHAALKHDLKEKFKSTGETFNSKEDSLTLKKKLVESWENEILADIYGQTLLNTYTDIENNFYRKDFDKVGAVFFFQCIDILEKSLLIIKNETLEKKALPEDSITQAEILSGLFLNKDSAKIDYDKISFSWIERLHPPNEIRQAFVSNILNKNLKRQMQIGNLTNEQYGFYKLAINMTATINHLFEIIKPKLINISQKYKSSRK